MLSIMFFFPQHSILQKQILDIWEHSCLYKSMWRAFYSLSIISPIIVFFYFSVATVFFMLLLTLSSQLSSVRGISKMNSPIFHYVSVSLCFSFIVNSSFLLFLFLFLCTLFCSPSFTCSIMCVLCVNAHFRATYFLSEVAGPIVRGTLTWWGD